MNFNSSSQNGLKLDPGLNHVWFSATVSKLGLVPGRFWICHNQTVRFELVSPDEVGCMSEKVRGMGWNGRFWGDLGWMPNLDQCVTKMLIRNEPLYKFIFEPFSLPLRSSSLQIPWNHPKSPFPGLNLKQGIVDGPTGRLDPKWQIMNAQNSSLKFFCELVRPYSE